MLAEGKIYKRRDADSTVYVWTVAHGHAWLYPVRRADVSPQRARYRPGSGTWNEWMLGPGWQTFDLPAGWERDRDGRVSAARIESEAFIALEV